jgi:hypothetical protein
MARCFCRVVARRHWLVSPSGQLIALQRFIRRAIPERWSKRVVNPGEFRNVCMSASLQEFVRTKIVRYMPVNSAQIALIVAQCKHLFYLD